MPSIPFNVYGPTNCRFAAELTFVPPTSMVAEVDDPLNGMIIGEAEYKVTFFVEVPGVELVVVVVATELP